MSRFYDALTQAINADVMPAAVANGSDTLKPAIHQLPGTDAPGAHNSAAAVIAAAEKLAHDRLSERDEPVENAAESGIQSVGELRNIAVDRDARVLPNAADPAVL